MPELPDVEIFARIASKCVGRTVHQVSVEDAGLLKGISAGALRQRLKNTRVSAAHRYGKHLFLDLSVAGSLATHFGTNGSLRLLHEGEAEPPYVRLSLAFEDGERLAYLNPRRIGEVRLVDGMESFVKEAHLGPDALDRRLDVKALQQIIARGKRDIKTILMDQQSLAGIGNIYSDEILFQARISPTVRGDALTNGEIEHLLNSIKDVLKVAIAHGAGSEEGAERLPRGFLIRERHKGGSCPRCGAPLATAKRSGRTSYYCPRCQPE